MEIWKLERIGRQILSQDKWENSKESTSSLEIVR